MYFSSGLSSFRKKNNRSEIIFKLYNNESCLILRVQQERWIRKAQESKIFLNLKKLSSTKWERKKEALINDRLMIELEWIKLLSSHILTCSKLEIEVNRKGNKGKNYVLQSSELDLETQKERFSTNALCS